MFLLHEKWSFGQILQNKKVLCSQGLHEMVPKGCEVPNEKKKSIGLTFVNGPNFD